MKNKINAVLSRGMLSLAVLSTPICLTAFAADEAQPRVQLGVVAQRYPWNGTIDVGYKASGLPAAGTNAVVTVTASGKSYTQDAVIANGTNTVAFTGIPNEIKAKDAKVKIEVK